MTSQYTLWFLILAGLLAAGGLLYFIVQQIQTLKKAERLKRALATKSEATREHIISSLRVLARCIVAEQVEYTEACIRIKVLLDNIAPELHKLPDFAIFNHIYDATAHMPTHDARREVDRRFLFKLDKQRWDLETEHEKEIKLGAEKLLLHQWQQP